MNIFQNKSVVTAPNLVYNSPMTNQTNFVKCETKSGVPLWVLPMPYLDSISIGVAVNAGTRDEVWPKEAGIAHALEHMHFRGTKDFPNSQKITEYIEETGGKINARTSSEFTFYDCRLPSKYAERAIHIISEQFKNSIFPEDKIPVEMKNIIQELHRRNDDLQRYLWKISQEFIYNNHPLSKDTLGLEKSLQNFKKEDFLSFKERYYNSSNYTFVVIGNIESEKAVELFDKYFPEKIKKQPNIRPIENINLSSNRVNIVKKDIQQTHISLSPIIGKVSDASWLYLDFYASMISGGISFPLFQEVRDNLGLCYAISAGTSRQTDFSRFNVYIGTDHKRYKQAIEAIFEIIEKYKRDEFLLEKVKNLKLGKLSLNYEHTG
ncbi:MAG: pitrilysin family protein, partial [Lutibacter sp.]